MLRPRNTTDSKNETLPGVRAGASAPRAPALAVALAWLATTGCARAPDADAAAARGKPCTSDSACNRLPDGGVARCGALRICVAGHCEVAADGGAAASQAVACSDAGR